MKKSIIKINLFMLFFFIAGIRHAVSQPDPIDSLKHLLLYVKHDTIRVGLYAQLAELIEDDNVWPAYNDSALKLAERLLRSDKFSKNRNVRSALAASINNKGFLYRGKGNFGKALDCYQSALKQYEQLDEKEGIGAALNNIAFVHQNMGNFKSALEHYQRSLKLKEAVRDTSGMILAICNIGSVYENLKDTLKVYDHYLKALQISGNVKDKRTLSFLYYSVARVYILKGDYTKGLHYNFLALNIRKATGDVLNYAHSCANMSGIYLNMLHKTDSAELFVNEAMKIAKENNYIELQKRCYRILYTIWKERGNPLKALHYHEIYARMNDSLIGADKQREVVRMQMNYEFDKKEELAREEEMRRELEHESQKQKQRVVIFAVGFILLVVLVFSVLLYKRFVLTRKQRDIIEVQKNETEQQKLIIEEQKHIVEENRKEIIDSIHYAKRIQTALLAHKEFIDLHLSDYFILFRPKDIVSGDFYAAFKKDQRFYLAVCDSTGHGVPGAFMSLLNITYLNEAIVEKAISEPGQIFNFVRTRLIDTVSREGQKDGFDGILVCFDFLSGKVSYAAANNSPLLVKEGVPVELECDRMPVGMGEKKDSFRTFDLFWNKDEHLYLYTDGFADQFGGPKGKKFKYKQLNELIASNVGKTSNDQNSLLLQAFDNWKGELEQVDDVCVIGIPYQSHL